MSKPNLIIYHANCADGVAAAWCFSRVFRTAAEYIPATYQDDAPDCRGKTVYLVDFCYSTDVMWKILEVAEKVVVLDHHITAIRNLESIKNHPKLDMAWCDVNKSGCGIAWNYVSEMRGEPSTAMPRLLYHIQDRDLWIFDSGNTAALSSFLFTRPLTIGWIDNVVALCSDDETYYQTIDTGLLLVEQHMNIVRDLCKNKRIVGLDSYLVALVNAPLQFASDVGNILAKEFEVAAIYYDTGTGRKFSLRSNADNPKAVDVSQIAAKFGGGGHKNAAGFFVSNKHPLASMTWLVDS